AALVLDRFPKLLIDDSHLGSGRRLPVPYAREAKEIAGKLCATRMEDEGSAHSEDDRTNRPRRPRCLAEKRGQIRGIGCGWAVGRPVVIDLMHELDEPLQCGGPRIERGGPGFYVRDVFETARQRLQQLRLLS